MQTIESIRRTNELSKVLKQHGFATNSFDAVHSANEMTGSESEVFESAPAKNASIPDSQLLQKLQSLERSKHLLSSRVDSLQQELLTSKDQFKQVLARLDSAEAKLRVLRTAPAQAPSSVVAPQEAPTQQSAQPAQEERQRHPRQAKMDPKFAIENVFYCGTK